MKTEPLRSGFGAAVRLGLALVFTLPLALMVSGSLRMVGLPPPVTVEWLPDPLAWENYPNLIDYIPIAAQFANSMVVSVVGTALTVVTASWAGLALAQLPRRWQRRLVGLAVVLMMTPLPALWLTRYVLFAWLGWVDSYLALWAPGLMGGSPLFVLLFYAAFRRLPVEWFEVARLEGAGALTIWRRVALPLVTPTTASVALLAFAFFWGDFISPLLYLRSEGLYTLPVGVYVLQQLDRTNWPVLMAGAVVMTAPVVVLFGLAQRWFLRGSRLTGIYE